MAQIVKLRRSSVPGARPDNDNLQLGELALNTFDGKAYMAKSGSTGPSVVDLVTTNTFNDGDITLNGTITATTFTGSFVGDGSGLTNISASSVVGLELDRISDGAATASISSSEGFRINTNTIITGSLTVTTTINATSITGSFSGNGNNLTNVPVSISGSDGTTQLDKTFTKLQIDNLSGLEVTEPVSGTAFIKITDYKGYGLSEITTPSSTWNIQHNLNFRYPIVQVYGLNNKVLIPTDIESIDDDNITITFSSNQTGRVIIIPGIGQNKVT